MAESVENIEKISGAKEKFGFGASMRSIGGAFGTGLNAGLGRGFSSKSGLGATLSLGAAGASIGAGAAAIGTNGNINPAIGAAAGAVAGAAALPMAGFAVGAVGNAGVGIAKAIPGVASAIGKGAVAATPYAAAGGVIAANSIGSKIWNVGSKLINWNENAEGFDKVKFTGPFSGAAAGWKNGRAFTGEFSKAKGLAGKTKAFMKNPLENTRAAIGKSGGAAGGTIINGGILIGGITLAEGVKKAWGTLESEKMGRMTGVSSMTSQIPNYSNERTGGYANNAGATGDLVFALKKNGR